MDVEFLEYVNTGKDWCGAAKQVTDHCDSLSEAADSLDTLENYQEHGAHLFLGKDGGYFLMYKEFHREVWHIGGVRLLCRNIKEGYSRILSAREVQCLLMKLPTE